MSDNVWIFIPAAVIVQVIWYVEGGLDLLAPDIILGVINWHQWHNKGKENISPLLVIKFWWIGCRHNKEVNGEI